MFCPNCGTQLPDGATFCSNCGAKLGAAQPQKPAAPKMPNLNLKGVQVPNVKFDINAIKSGNKGEIGRLIILATAVLQVLVLICYLAGGIKMSAFGASETATFMTTFSDGLSMGFVGVLGLLVTLAAAALAVLALVMPVVPKKISDIALIALNAVAIIIAIVCVSKLKSLYNAEMADYGGYLGDLGIKIGMSFGGVMLIIFAVLIIAGAVYSIVTENK